MFAALNSFLTGALAKVTDVYWPFVSMLLHGDGTNAAQNNTFLDGSANNFTVTRNGNTTQGSFNPFVSTYPYAVATNGGSAYFDGTGDSLTVPANAALNLGANNFTIEYWVYQTSAVFQYVTGQADVSGSSVSFVTSTSAGGVPSASVFFSGGTINRAITSSITAPLNTWSHIAFVRDGATSRLYVNGVQGGTNALLGTSSVDTSTGSLGVGKWGDYTPNPFFGYISNFRLVNGTCLYPSGTTFTPPTAPLTAVTNTALLLGMSNGAIFDNTMLNNLETVANAQISTSVFKYGTGALKFNGTTDYLVTPAKTALNLGTADFTIEMWVNPAAISSFGILFSFETVNQYLALAQGTGSVFGLTAYDGANLVNSTASVTPINQWTHIAFVRVSGTLYLYIGGVASGSGTFTGSFGSSTNKSYTGFSSSYPTLYFYNGYIDDLRVTKGIARYTTTFTPPTAAFPNQAPTYPSGTATQRAIFGFGADGGGSPYSMTNIVSNTGVVAGDTTGVGTARGALAAAGYGGDKAIFGFGSVSGAGTAKTNLVSNTGVVATDTTGVGWVRYSVAASGYGSTGQAIFGFGYALDAFPTAITSLVSNTGVVATDTAGVGTARNSLAAAKYGTDKAIFGFGIIAGVSTALTNLVSNTGVVSTDTAGVGTARYAPSAAGYGTDKAIFGYGYTGAAYVSTTNLVSNTGVVATDTTGVGTAGYFRSAAGYGGDKAIFGYGYNGAAITSTTNLVSNTGVVATDTTGVGTARQQIAAAGFSYS